jgi:hypothetical protein
VPAVVPPPPLPELAPPTPAAPPPGVIGEAALVLVPAPETTGELAKLSPPPLASSLSSASAGLAWLAGSPEDSPVDELLEALSLLDSSAQAAHANRRARK